SIEAKLGPKLPRALELVGREQERGKLTTVGGLHLDEDLATVRFVGPHVEARTVALRVRDPLDELRKICSSRPLQSLAFVLDHPPLTQPSQCAVSRILLREIELSRHRSALD